MSKENTTYRFRTLVDVFMKDGEAHLKGPFSPVEGAKVMARHLDITFTNLIRFDNPFTTCGLDYLVLRKDYIQKETGEKHVMYFAYIDMGYRFMPMTIWDSVEPDEVILTEIYQNSLTDEAQKAQREDCEIYNKNDYPILSLTKDDWLDFYRELHALNLKANGWHLAS
jgi:hypothetical protein